MRRSIFPPLFFFNDTATTEIYTLSLHDALPILTAPTTPAGSRKRTPSRFKTPYRRRYPSRSEEYTSELQSPDHLVCRLLLEKKKTNSLTTHTGRSMTSPSAI